MVKFPRGCAAAPPAQASSSPPASAATTASRNAARGRRLGGGWAAGVSSAGGGPAAELPDRTGGRGAGALVAVVASVRPRAELRVGSRKAVLLSSVTRSSEPTHGWIGRW